MPIGVGVAVKQLKKKRTATKTSMGAKEACLEACSERASKTESLDRTKTGENRYWFGGYEVEPMSGYEVVDWLFEEQDKRSSELVAEGKRKIRSDTSVGVTMVIYADSKVTRTMDAYQIAKLRHFLLHSITPFLGHEPEIVIEHNDEGFDKDGNQIGGVHWHIIDRFKDKNGDYEFHKRCNKYALKKMHKDFVRYMRGEIPDVNGEYIDEPIDVEAHKEGGDPAKASGVSATVRGQILDERKSLEEKSEQLDEAKTELENAKLEVKNESEKLATERDEFDQKVSDFKQAQYEYVFLTDKKKSELEEKENDIELKRKAHKKNEEELEKERAKLEAEKQTLEDEKDALKKRQEKFENESRIREQILIEREAKIEEREDELEDKEEAFEKRVLRQNKKTSSDWKKLSQISEDLNERREKLKKVQQNQKAQSNLLNAQREMLVKEQESIEREKENIAEAKRTISEELGVSIDSDSWHTSLPKALREYKERVERNIRQKIHRAYEALMDFLKFVHGMYIFRDERIPLTEDESDIYGEMNRALNVLVETGDVELKKKTPPTNPALEAALDAYDTKQDESAGLYDPTV